MTYRRHVSLHGQKLGMTQDGILVAPQGLVIGDPGKQTIVGSQRHAAVFDDFFTLDTTNNWQYVEGTDSGTSSAAILDGGVGGVLRLTTGDAGTGLAADSCQLTRFAKMWKASAGNLCIEARLKLSAITTCYAFFGFTDTVAASLEAPIVSAASADTITTTATDAVGWMFDTRMSTDDWWLVGVANDVDATKQDSGYAPVADTYRVLRIELDTSGNALFFRDGVQVGSKMTSAVTPSVALTPVIYVSKTSVAASMTMDIDYIHVSSDRA